jgi:probable HAF family extracellular repeat protein
MWRAGSVTNLGTRIGNNSAAFAVNSAGVAAGYATNTTPDPFLGFQQKAARFDRGTVQDLPTLGGPDAIALLINERGQIAGISLTNATPVANNPCAPGTQPWEPFLWDNGKLFDIGNFGGSCGMVNAMNDRGEVVGQSYESGDTIARGFLWQSGHLRDVGTLGGSNASAEAIDEAGDVVGYADLSGAGCNGLSCIHHGFLLKNGAMTDLRPRLGDPCSRAVAINNERQVVGASIPVCGGADVTALLWENGRPIDLNTVIAPGADMTLAIALAINDRGVITGDGLLSNGDTHAFVLVPCQKNCGEVKLGEASLLHSSHKNSERMLNQQRTGIFRWRLSSMAQSLKE